MAPVCSHHSQGIDSGGSLLSRLGVVAGKVIIESVKRDMVVALVGFLLTSDKGESVFLFARGLPLGNGGAVTGRQTKTSPSY